MVVFYGLKMFINFGFEGQAINAVGIAVIHSLFNIVTTLILLPFSKKLVRLAELTIRDKKDEKDDGAMDVQILDERLFTTPTVAIERAREVTCDLAGLSKDALKKAIEALDHYSDETDAFVRKTEEKTDIYEDRLGTYLIRLSSKELSIQGSREISEMLHSITDFERIADHSVNLLETAKEIYGKKVVFSVEATGELHLLESAVMEIVDMATAAFAAEDLKIAQRVEPLEQVIDKLCAKLKTRHVERLKNGECTMEQGFIFIDLLTNCERVADHCSNIAGSLIQIQEDSYQVHEYLNQVKTSSNDFEKEYEQFKVKYSLS